MISFLIALGLLLPVLAEYPEDYLYIHAPAEVIADTPFQARLDVDVHNGITKWISDFRLSLAIYTGDSSSPRFTSADCYLIKQQTVCDPSIEVALDYIAYGNNTFNVTIPSGVGPSGKHYVLSAQTLQTDGSYYGANLYSSFITLQEATGNFSSLQQARQQTLWGSDAIPCTGFSCVRNCADEAYSKYQAANQTSSNTTDYQKCANDCPGVSIDFEGSTRGGQPTASLTTPTSCSIHSSVSVTVTGDATAVQSSPSRASATPTGGGSVTLCPRLITSCGLAILILGISIEL